jgi:hypothetical protein
MILSNKVKRCISLFLVLTLVLIPQTVFAYTYKDKDDENYRILSPIKKVEPDKEWKIEFNEELKPSTVNNNNVKVTDDKNRRISVKVIYSKKDKSIKVRPYSNSYIPGRTYTLIVEKDVRSIDGKKLEKAIKQEFKITNVYAGLPYENGLVIVDDIAYSPKYLKNNAVVRSEIINEDFQVFYCFDPTEQIIRDIVGNAPMTGKEIKDLPKRIVYIDESGNKNIYEYNEKEKEYEYVVPKADITITNNSIAGVIAVKLNELKGVEGAKYCKLGHSDTIKSIEELTKKNKSGKKEAFRFISQEKEEDIYILASNKVVLAEGKLSTGYSNRKQYRLKLKFDKSSGNSLGNINNNGYAAADLDGYVYYNNTGDGNRLYKKDVNGMFERAICEHDAQYINVSEGWVYYSNYSDKGKLYRVKTDGAKIEKLNDEQSAYVTISGEWIYYSNHNDKGRIYKIKKDGSDAVIDNQGNINGIPLSKNEKDETAFLNIIGDWIYYTNKSDKHKLYAINTEATYKAKIADVWADSIQVHGDWIYHTSGTGVLSKVKKDGSGEVVPIKAKAKKFDKGFHLNVVGDWLYYSDANDEGKLYKITTDGSGRKRKLSDDPVTYINIVGDTIYYVSDGKLCRLPIDASGREVAEEIGKTENPNKVSQMDDLTKVVPYEEVNNSLKWIEDKYLPERVGAILDDNTQHQLVVLWDRENVKIQEGVRIYTGNAVGFDKTIEFRLIIPSEMLNETTTIEIFNNPSRGNDIMYVYNEYNNNPKLNPPELVVGNTIRVYDAEEDGTLIGEAKVERENKYNIAKITGLEFDDNGHDSVFVSVIREGKTESKRTEVRVSDIPTITDVKDMDTKNEGIAISDFKIESFLTPQLMTSSLFKVYIVPAGRRVDLTDEELEPRGIIENEEDEDDDELSWSGKDDEEYKNKETDSMGNILKVGNYDMMVASYFETSGSEDNRGRKPYVKGVVSSKPFKVLGVAEEIPNQPNVKEQIVNGGKEIIIGTVPKQGEKAFLIPYFEDEPECPEVDQEHSTLDNEAYVYEMIKKNQEDDIQNYKLKVYAKRLKMYKLFEYIKTWRAEYDGDLEFDEKPVTEEEILRFKDRETGDTLEVERYKYFNYIRGNGRKNNFAAPNGFEFLHEDEDGTKGYCPNVEYRLFILNAVGSSEPSVEFVIVDNKPPVMDIRWILENWVERMKLEDSSSPIADIPYYDKEEVDYKEVLAYLTLNGYGNILTSEELEGITPPKYVVGVNNIPLKAMYEDADVYVVDKNINVNTVDSLENAVSRNDAYKFPIVSGNKKEMDTSAIKGTVFDSIQNYYIVAVDGAGNISSSIPITVSVNVDYLKDLYIEADRLSETIYMIEDRKTELLSIIEECKSAVAKAESEVVTDIIKQQEIDAAYNKLKNIMIEIGLPGNYRDFNDEDRDGSKRDIHVTDTLRSMKNFLKNFRDRYNRNNIVNKNELTEDIWLPKEYKSLVTSSKYKERGYKYDIKDWITSGGISETFKDEDNNEKQVLKPETTSSGEWYGEVNRGFWNNEDKTGNLEPEFIFNIINEDGTPEEVEIDYKGDVDLSEKVTVKGQKINMVVEGKDIKIETDGISIGSISSDIKVELETEEINDGANTIKITPIREGQDGLYYVKFKLINGPDGDLNEDHEVEVTISIKEIEYYGKFKIYIPKTDWKEAYEILN